MEPPKTRRRSGHDIIVEILTHLKIEPSRRTTLMHALRMNYGSMLGYTDKLIKCGYVVERSLAPKRGCFYSLSPSGGEFLLKLQESRDLIYGVLEK